MLRHVPARRSALLVVLSVSPVVGALFTASCARPVISATAANAQRPKLGVLGTVKRHTGVVATAAEPHSTPSLLAKLIALAKNNKSNATTAAVIAVLFLLTGLAEIGGGWLVWQAVREGKPWWWALLGSLTLVVYGFIPTLQPLPDFGRLYAVYGGLFIAMSYIWGVRFDGLKTDRGDVIGSIVALVGVGIALLWPRGGRPVK